jgi:hypothetical protein
MQEQPKAPPSVEQSVKYMAWDLKKLVEQVQRIADAIVAKSDTKDIPF